MNRIKNISLRLLLGLILGGLCQVNGSAQTTVVRLFKEAENLMDKGRYKQAIEKYDSIYLFQPGNPKLFYNRASAYIYTQKYSKALVDLNKSISLDTAYYDAYFNRAFVHSFLRNDAFAIGDYTVYLEKFPNDEEALLARGKLYMEQQEYTSAIADLRKYAGLGNKNHEVYISLYYAYRATNQPNAAQLYLDSALVVKPLNSKYNTIKAEMLFDDKKYEEACTYYDKAIRSNYGNIDLYIAKAEAKYLQGLYNDAVVEMDNALKYKPNNPNLHYDKAFYLLQSKRYKESLAAGKNALKHQYSDSSTLYFLLAVCSNNLGLAEDACTYFTKANQLGNKDAANYLKQVCED